MRLAFSPSANRADGMGRLEGQSMSEKSANQAALRGRRSRRDTALTIMSASFTPPANGEPITMGPNGRLVVPDNPILPFVEGDGTGRDIWKASVRVLDAAVAKAYAGKRKIAWYEVYAGEKAYKLHSSWLPEETVAAFRKY